jgi:arylsulfatase A-like enzyme
MMDRLHAIASISILTAILAVLVATLTYIPAALAAPLCRTSFQNAAREALSFVASVALVIPTLEVLQHIVVIPDRLWKQIAFVLAFVILAVWMIRKKLQLTTSPFLPTLLNVLLIVASVPLGLALWMTRKKLQLTKVLLLPRILTFVVLLASVPLVVQEAIQNRPLSESGVVRAAGNRGNQSRDIVLVTFDALSARHLHSNGYERSTSPNLDAFSANAIVFDNFYANANWTRPGIASILDGVRPWTHEADVQIPSRALTGQQNLISILAAAGYDVNIVQSNFNAGFGDQGIRPSGHEIYLDNCYRLFRWIPVERLPSFYFARDFGPNKIIDDFEENYLGRQDGREFRYLSASEELLRNASSQRPMFFWIHAVITHDPYAASAPFLGVFDGSPDARTPRNSKANYLFADHPDQKRQLLLRARYDEAVLMADDLFGKIISLLKQQGRFDQSLIVVTADHGESFLPVYGGHGGPLLTEDLIRIPCFIKPPSAFTAKHESLLMEEADLAPTILTYAGLPVPAKSEGRAYPDKPEDLPVFSINRDFRAHEKSLNVAMREGDWKYVIHFGRWKHPWPQRELYNLASDAQEQTNLVSSQPERAASMQQVVLEEISRHGISLNEFQP